MASSLTGWDCSNRAGIDDFESEDRAPAVPGTLGIYLESEVQGAALVRAETLGTRTDVSLSQDRLRLQIGGISLLQGGQAVDLSGVGYNLGDDFTELVPGEALLAYSTRFLPQGNYSHLTIAIEAMRYVVPLKVAFDGAAPLEISGLITIFLADGTNSAPVGSEYFASADEELPLRTAVDSAPDDAPLEVKAGDIWIQWTQDDAARVVLSSVSELASNPELPAGSHAVELPEPFRVAENIPPAIVIAKVAFGGGLVFSESDANLKFDLAFDAAGRFAPENSDSLKAVPGLQFSAIADY